MGYNKVFIATSIDGFIADRKGGIDWLDLVPNPEGEDMGYFNLIESIDAIVMGRNSYETVLGFDIDWPYPKPVFVLSSRDVKVSDQLSSKVFAEGGDPNEIVSRLESKGYSNLYIDGGKTIQDFMANDLINEMVITTIPIVLGGGVPLFGDLSAPQQFELLDSKVYLKDIVQRTYIRKTSNGEQ